MTSEGACLDALRSAAEQLGESPTKAQYRETDIAPSASTIVRILGGWNEAKRQADPEGYTQDDAGDGSIHVKPDDVEIPPERIWDELTPQQRWYYKNRKHRIETKEERRKALGRWFSEYKREECVCSECGESYAACLDFHHPDTKTLSVSRMVNHGYSKERIRSEIADCVIICANCHRKQHSQVPAEIETGGEVAGQAGWIRVFKTESDECNRCSVSDHRCLDFHHIGEKTDRIARMVADNQPRDDIRHELEHCELLCANCHRREHHDEEARV